MLVKVELKVAMKWHRSVRVVVQYEKLKFSMQTMNSMRWWQKFSRSGGHLVVFDMTSSRVI